MRVVMEMPLRNPKDFPSVSAAIMGVAEAAEPV